MYYRRDDEERLTADVVEFARQYRLARVSPPKTVATLITVRIDYLCPRWADLADNGCAL